MVKSKVWMAYLNLVENTEGWVVVGNTVNLGITGNTDISGFSWQHWLSLL